MKVLAVIPARGGSKGLPGKNIRELNGKPLICWTIDALSQSEVECDLVISTDCPEIARVCNDHGAFVNSLRPSWLSGDEAPAIEVARFELIRRAENYDYVLWLQPTSPLRLPKHIDEALSLAVSKSAESVFSVSEAEVHPSWMGLIKDTKEFSFLLPDKKGINRQALPKIYQINGAIYVNTPKWLMEQESFTNDGSLAYVMDREYSVDIDTRLDWILAEGLFKLRLSRC